jgi:hypothetical protein
MARRNNRNPKPHRDQHGRFVKGSVVIDTQLTLKCDGCGAELRVLYIPHQKAPIETNVEPCQMCMAGAIEEGKSNGYSEGLAEGRILGKVEGDGRLESGPLWGCLRCGHRALDAGDGDCPDCGEAVVVALDPHQLGAYGALQSQKDYCAVNGIERDWDDALHTRITRTLAESSRDQAISTTSRQYMDDVEVEWTYASGLCRVSVEMHNDNGDWQVVQRGRRSPVVIFASSIQDDAQVKGYVETMVYRGNTLVLQFRALGLGTTAQSDRATLRVERVEPATHESEPHQVVNPHDPDLANQRLVLRWLQRMGRIRQAFTIPDQLASRIAEQCNLPQEYVEQLPLGRWTRRVQNLVVPNLAVINAALGEPDEPNIQHGPDAVVRGIALDHKTATFSEVTLDVAELELRMLADKAKEDTGDV